MVISFFLLVILALAEASTLSLVQLLYRHGDRTPSHTFPTDQYRYLWKEGDEMLTPLGMRQHFQLGQYLRQRYHDFLPEEYKFNDTVVRSTDNDRTILSALAQLRGLYPKTYAPKDGFPFTELIPVHSVPKKYDQVMKMTSPCPAYKKLWKEMQHSKLWMQLEAENRDFFHMLAVATGLSHVGLIKSFHIADVVNVWLAHNLSLPSWVTPEVIQRLAIMADWKQTLRYHSPEMARLRGGPLLGLMSERMVAKVSGSILDRGRLLYSYSAHDSTLSAFLTVLGIFNNRKPHYVSCIIIELHRSGSTDKPEDHFVRILYRNDTRKAPMLMKLPECASDCPLPVFLTLIKGKVPANIQEECFPSERTSLITAVTSFDHSSALLVSAIVSLGTVIICCYRRRSSKVLAT